MVLNNEWKILIMPVYAPTSAYDNEEVEIFYEDVEVS